MRKSRVVGVLCFALVTAVVLQPAGASVITACADRKSGQLHTIAAGEACAPNEALLTWNMEGPQGPHGVQGPAGPPGAIDFGRIYNRICTDQFFCSCDTGDIVLSGGAACDSGISVSAPGRDPDSCPELHDCAPSRHWLASCVAPTGEPQLPPTDIVIHCLRP